MNEPFVDRRHEHADDLLEGYILDTLSDEDRAWMDAHMSSCPTCQQELAPLMSAVHALPFAAPEPDVQMSDAVWDRIATNITGSAPKSSDKSFVPLEDATVWNIPQDAAAPTRMMPRQWMLVAALMVISLIGGTILGQILPRFNESETQTQQIAIQFTDPNITARGELRYLPEEQVFVLTVNGMPAAPDGKVYQAWLIQGDTPVPVGVMNDKKGEVASTGDRSQFDTFAITVESGPFGNEQPTSEPILVAPLHNDKTEG